VFFRVLLVGFSLFRPGIARAPALIACYRKGSISSRVGIRGRVGISGRVGIGASSSKDVFRLSKVPFLLYRALSIVYSREVGK
jgi:hypothetical protein